ncbi:MAG: flagellar motor protein [Burkholderiaceae bacterium]|nr:flagellar motor protein [Burkholderiaceae bacterium]
MDWGSLIGIVLGVGGILAGQMLEGGSISSLVQPAAFVIVFMGTVGAVILQSGLGIFWRGVKMVRLVFFPPRDDFPQLREEVTRLSQLAWREGILALEAQISGLSHPFSRVALRQIVDSTEPTVLRGMLETEIQLFEEKERLPLRVWESAGGYSPTIGIIGAVLGLIHVMENLSEPAKLGGGIAVAFVATIYGVGLANLIFLPIGNRLKGWLSQEVHKREVLLEAFYGISMGEHPRSIADRLALFSQQK